MKNILVFFIGLLLLAAVLFGLSWIAHILDVKAWYGFPVITCTVLGDIFSMLFGTHLISLAISEDLS